MVEANGPAEWRAALQLPFGSGDAARALAGDDRDQEAPDFLEVVEANR
jgi:hypothetical protein